MPELAEVEYYRKQWDPGLGQPVTRVAVHEKARVYRSDAGSGENRTAASTAKALGKDLPGAVFTRSHAHGKNLLFEFSSPDRKTQPSHWIGGHLGMTGKLSVASPDYRPGKHDHLVLYQEKQALVFADPRKFGRIRYHQGPEPPAWWQALPPEVLSKAFTKDRLAEAFKRRKSAPIKALLLDQDLFPGIGNWMADEILWQAQLDPHSPGAQVTETAINKLWRTTRQVTRTAVKTIGEDWSDPPDTWLFKHRWEDGGRCPRCRGPLARDEVRGRTTCWCATCQEGRR